MPQAAANHPRFAAALHSKAGAEHSPRRAFIQASLPPQPPRCCCARDGSNSVGRGEASAPIRGVFTGKERHRACEAWRVARPKALAARGCAARRLRPRRRRVLVQPSRAAAAASAALPPLRSGGAALGGAGRKQGERSGAELRGRQGGGWWRRGPPCRGLPNEPGPPRGFPAECAKRASTGGRPIGPLFGCAIADGPRARSALRSFPSRPCPDSPAPAPRTLPMMWQTVTKRIKPMLATITHTCGGTGWRARGATPRTGAAGSHRRGAGGNAGPGRRDSFCRGRRPSAARPLAPRVRGRKQRGAHRLQLEAGGVVRVVSHRGRRLASHARHCAARERARCGADRGAARRAGSRSSDGRYWRFNAARSTNTHSAGARGAAAARVLRPTDSAPTHPACAAAAPRQRESPLIRVLPEKPSGWSRTRRPSCR